MFLVRDIPGPFTGRSFGKEIISSKGTLQVHFNGCLFDSRNKILFNYRDPWWRYCYIKKWIKELKEE